MRLTAAVDIDAPPETVWRCIDEPALIVRWVEGALEHRYIDPRDPAHPVGQRFVQRLQQGKKVTEFTGTLIAFERPRHFAFTIPSPAYSSEAHFRLTPLDAVAHARRLCDRRHLAHRDGEGRRRVAALAAGVLRAQADAAPEGARRKHRGSNGMSMAGDDPGRQMARLQTRRLVGVRGRRQRRARRPHDGVARRGARDDRTTRGRRHGCATPSSSRRTIASSASTVPPACFRCRSACSTSSRTRRRTPSASPATTWARAAATASRAVPQVFYPGDVRRRHRLRQRARLRPAGPRRQHAAHGRRRDRRHRARALRRVEGADRLDQRAVRQASTAATGGAPRSARRCASRWSAIGPDGSCLQTVAVLRATSRALA